MRPYWRNALVLFASFLLAAAATGSAPTGGVLRVDDDAPPGGDGLTWDTAYRFLQDALADASGGGVIEIRVAQGTYKPDRDEANPDGTGDREATFQLINNFSLMGGYAGIGAEDPDARDFEIYETILSGDLLSNDVPDVPFEDQSRQDNSFHVMTGTGNNTSAILDGVTVTAGNTMLGGGVNTRGAGIINNPGSPSFSYCQFIGNMGNTGGGMYNGGGSNPSIVACLFMQNFSENAGGGIRNESGSSPNILDCEFVGNSSENGGAGIFSFQNCDPVITNCTFTNNVATDFQSAGGAVRIEGNSSTIFVNCAFRENEAGFAGGGVATLVLCTSSMTDCVFLDNQARRGGATGNDPNSQVTFQSCIFTGNSATAGHGGAVAVGSSSALLTDCVFEFNTAIGRGGAFFADGSSPTLDSCSFIANAAVEGGAVFAADGSALINKCLFLMNTADNGGGLYNFHGGDAIVRDSIFAANASMFFAGGAVYNEDLSSPEFTSCIFTGNTSVWRGAGMTNGQSSTPEIINCTFSNNIAEITCGGIYSLQNSSPVIVNTILWENTDTDDSTSTEEEQIYNDNASVSLSFSCVQGLTGKLGGVGNISVNPLFFDADGQDDLPGTEDDDLRLSPGSPCIDAADNTAVPKDVTADLDGNPRFVDDPDTKDTGNGDPPIVDMGAYEFQGAGIIEASLDIKPGSCPNSFNRNSHGMLPAAILGSDQFDAAQIDISSISLSRADGIGGSIAPNEGPPGPHSVLDDVATPFDGEPCDCHELGGDGLIDLVMHFSSPELVEALELNDLPAGTQVPLIVSGELFDGRAFTATDCVRLVPASDMNGDGVVGSLDLMILFNLWGSCADCVDCSADLDGDCTVGAAELVILLSSWG